MNLAESRFWPVADSFDFYADLALVVSGSGVVGAI
jgi:hypothetical protein